MSSVKRYEVNGSSSFYEDEKGSFVDYEDYAALEAKCAVLAAENAGLKDFVKTCFHAAGDGCDMDGNDIQELGGRPMSNINKQLRTDLLIANALETAKQLRELQESPVAEAIFESIVENENGKEIQFERPISDLAFAAFWQLEKLVTALGAAEKRIAELEAREVVLPPTFWYEHDDLSRDVPVLDKRLVKKAIRAAGISIKGE